MTTKLTLTIEEDVIAKAKVLAKEQNRSLSNLIENYLRSLTAERNPIPSPNDTPITDKLYGILKGYTLEDDKKELEEILAEKYLKNG